MIGIAGQKGSGKSTLTNYLVDEHGFEEIAFAGPLKQAAKLMFRLSDEDVYTQEGKARQVDISGVSLGGVDEASLMLFGDDPEARWGQSYPHLRDQLIELALDEIVGETETVRDVLQKLGTEVGRQIDEDMWIKCAAVQIERTDAPVVISDVRFPNEAEAIRDWGGDVWGILRPGCWPDAHASELTLWADFQDMVDVTFANAGPKKALFAMASTELDAG